MKIGLLTQPLGHNYGGILQAYALKTVLERRGHKVLLLDWYSRVRHPLKELVRFCKGVIRRYILKRNVLYFSWLLSDKIATYKLRRFVSGNFNVRHFKKWLWGRNVTRGLDAIVVGSDQVWRPKYNRGTLIGHNFLDFCQSNNIRRVAYAASFGTDKCEFTEEQITAFSPLLQNFDGVSVREDSGVRLCRELFGVDALHLLDPTLLLDKEDYMEVAGISASDKPKGGLLLYVLDENESILNFAKEFAKDNSLEIFRCNSKYEDIEAPLRERIQPPIEDWLRAFYDADFVISDSFHATVFSIIFGKPFIIFGNADRGLARFESLLNLFGCRENMILSPSGYDVNKSYLPDQEIIKSTLSSEREKAFAFIDKYLPIGPDKN